MDVYYLKDTLFEPKSAQKKSLLLNAPKHILTTNPYTKETKALKTLKFITSEFQNPRTLHEKVLTENPDHLSKLYQMQENLKKLSNLKYLITEDQGVLDELLSRKIEQTCMLEELQKANTSIKSDLDNLNDKMYKEIDLQKAKLEDCTSSLETISIEISSTKKVIEVLNKDIENEDKAINNLSCIQSNLISDQQETQIKINQRLGRLEEKQFIIRNLLETNLQLHSLHIKDLEVKHKLVEEINKFMQIRKI